MDKLKSSLIDAKTDDYLIIQNLARFYVYDMSRYCGNQEGWECPKNGLYESKSFEKYLIDSDKYPFLIKVQNELAGFVLINKTGSSVEVDWNIGEFFILAKFQNLGIGKSIAKEVFKKFPGIWETSAMPENKKAISFWRKTVSAYTNNIFSEKCLILTSEEEKYPMIVFRFVN